MFNIGNIGKKTKKEDKVLIENLNELDEFKMDNDTIVTPYKKDEPIKTKKLPIEDLRDRVGELEEILYNEKNKTKEKKVRVEKSSIIASFALLGTLSLTLFVLSETKKTGENINSINQNLQTVSVANQDTKVVNGLSEEEIKKYLEPLTKDVAEFKKGIEEFKNSSKTTENVGLKKEDVEQILLTSEKMKEVDAKLVLALQDTDESKDKKLTDMMKKYEEANMLMTEVIKKQREEIISLNQRIEEIKTANKDKFTLTKDDLNKIAMLETRVLKDGDLIDNLNKQVSKLNEEMNNKKLNILNDSRVNDIRKNTNENVSVGLENTMPKVTDSKKDLPIFSVYKILNNGQFYLKNRINGKLLEQAISEKNVIINRYTVLNVDYENRTVIFKDNETGKSLTLLENE